mgnify:CR=1 FL=1
MTHYHIIGIVLATILGTLIGIGRLSRNWLLARIATARPGDAATPTFQSGIAQIAYNFDKPVIVTDVGGLAEVARDGVTGFVVPPNDAAALAGAGVVPDAFTFRLAVRPEVRA